MDTGQLSAFICVAECLSFSKASEQLHLTQSAVSKRIATLETELDVKLFERFGQRIKVTESGLSLLNDAREILHSVQHMHQRCDASKTTFAGTLRVVTSHHIGLHRLPTILKQFIKDYPDVTLDMNFQDSEIAFHEITQGNYDIAVVTLPLATTSSQESSTTITPLWKDDLAVMFSTTHPINKQEKISADLLSQYPAILPDEGTFTRRIINTVFSTQKVTYPVAFTTNYLETIKVMVETGMGWTVLPTIMKSDKLTAHPLPRASNCDTQEPITATRTLGIIVHKNKVITPALQAFINALIANADREIE